MKYSNIIIIILLLSILFAYNAESEALSGMQNIHFIVSGGGAGADNLLLTSNYRLDFINRINLLMAYRDDQFNTEATWQINFWQNYNSELNLQLALASSKDNNLLGKAFGLAGKGELSDVYNYFFDVKYFLDNQALVGRGGLVLPLIFQGKLTLGMGNTYWWHDRFLFNMGLKLKF